MKTEHLKLFIRIAATNNISQAGKEFGLSPAVASGHISKLEQGLGVRLVHRTTRKVSLTEEGIVFFPHAQEVIARIEEARASVGVGSITPQGTLRITAPASFGRMHLIPGLSGFTGKYPDLKIDLRLSDTITNLVDGGFDVAVRNSELNDSTLIARLLAPDCRIVCAAPKYLEQYGIPQTPDDLSDHKLIDLIGTESWVFRTPSGSQNVKHRGPLRTDNGEAVRDACIDGIGVAICSTWCAYQKLKAGELVEILSDFPLESNTNIWAVYPSSRLLAPKVRAFIDYFADYFGDSPYWEG